MSIHEGHRQRLKDRFLAEGLDGFTDVQVLELLLYHCIPRKDTNELAHELIDRFGSLSQVLDTGYIFGVDLSMWDLTISVLVMIPTNIPSSSTTGILEIPLLNITREASLIVKF